MVVTATTLVPDDAPQATVDGVTATPQAERFLDAFDVDVLRHAARAVEEPVSVPSEPPPRVAIEGDTLEEDEPKPPPPRARPAAPRAGGGSQFLAALVKRPPTRTPGTLVARARGGACRFWIDGVVRGEGRVVKVRAKPGPHDVACRGADGRPRVQRIDVVPGGIAVAAFHLDG